MYSRRFTLVALLLALTAGPADAAQIYGVRDSVLAPGAAQVYPLSIQDLASDAQGQEESLAATAAVHVKVPPGTFSKLACVVSTAPGAIQSWTFHLVKNETLSALTCPISNTTSGRSCSNTVDIVTVDNLDRVALQITPIATPATPASGSCTLLFQPLSP
jgi:hypothetical protein